MTRNGMEASTKDISDTKPDEFTYSSDYASPKISNVYTGQFTTDASGTVTVQVPHLLTYSPTVVAYIKKPDGRWYATGQEVQCLTDRIYVKLQAFSLVANTQYSYKFWVFTDAAEDTNSG